MQIFKSFTFDAAHHLADNVSAGHKYARLHGHSFDVEMTFEGTPDAQTGWIRDFAEIDAMLGTLRDQLDHNYLNDIEGLERPTLERVAIWLWERTKPTLPELVEVRITRGSCREGCIYRGG